MNSGILRSAHTTRLDLELEYCEPSPFCEIGIEPEHPSEPQHPERLFEEKLHALSARLETRSSS
jgi:hypothetical protein